MDVMLVFNVVVALFGAYMIWSALQMKKSGKINSMVLAQEELKKVKDTKVIYINRNIIKFFKNF